VRGRSAALADAETTVVVVGAPGDVGDVTAEVVVDVATRSVVLGVGPVVGGVVGVVTGVVPPVVVVVDADVVVVVVGAATVVVVTGTVVVVAGTVVVAAGSVVVGPGTVVVTAGTVVVIGAVVVVAGNVVVAAGTDVVETLVVVGTSSAHVGAVNLLVSSVTAASLASARPWTATLVVAVIEVAARMFPEKLVPVPSVAELPICQKTLHSWAPLINVTVLFDAVVSVVAVLKMNTEFGSLPPSRTTDPVSANGPRSAALYTPAGSGRGAVPRSAGSTVSTGRNTACAYAAARSTCACCAAASFGGPTAAGGVATPGGNPVIEGPGERPTLLSRTLKPVFVTVDAPRTE
jgi:hypothetical protein